MKGYILDYINENEYKKLQRALKKYNLLAFKKLNDEYYPLIRKGEFLGELVNSSRFNHTETYEVVIPGDSLFTQIHGDVKLRYIVYKDQKLVMLDTLMPTDILLEGHVAELTTYKGVMISKSNAEKDKFMVNLFSAMDDSKKCNCNRIKCPTCKGKGYID